MGSFSRGEEVSEVRLWSRSGRGLILAFILAACSNPSGYQPISAPGGRVEIADDSSVQAPQGSGWMMKRSKDETSEEVLFGRDLTASPTRAEHDHTLRVRFDVYRATGGAQPQQGFHT